MERVVAFPCPYILLVPYQIMLSIWSYELWYFLSLYERNQTIWWNVEKIMNFSTQHLQYWAMLSPDSIFALFSTNDTPTKHVRKMNMQFLKEAFFR